MQIASVPPTWSAAFMQTAKCLRRGRRRIFWPFERLRPRRKHPLTQQGCFRRGRREIPLTYECLRPGRREIADCKANSDQVGDVYFPKSLNQIDDLDIHLTKRMTNIRENRIPHLARL